MKVVLGFSPFDRLYAEKFLRAEELSDLCDAVIAEPFDVATMSEEEILSETFGRFDGAEVYVLLLGKSAAKELHIDAQIKTAMRAGLGIVVINLPFVEEESGVLAHSPEEANAIDAYKIWKPVPREREYIRAAHPYLPERIAENLLREGNG